MAEVAEVKNTLSRLSLLTFNVWFDRHRFLQRANALFELIELRNPDVVCLQEVLVEFVKPLFELPWVGERYALSDDGTASSWSRRSRYGVLMLVRKTLKPVFKHVEMESHMGRNLVTAAFNLDGTRFMIGSVHLESLNSHPLREAQLAAAAQVFKQSKADATILCGDFNFCSWRNFSGEGKLENDSLKEILPDHVDIWAALRPGEKGCTFDSSKNKMIEQDEVMRYDRVVAAIPDTWTADSIQIEGDEPLPGTEVWISDHFGLFATFSGSAPPQPKSHCAVS